jgi:hypothetical protein
VLQEFCLSIRNKYQRLWRITSQHRRGRTQVHFYQQYFYEQYDFLITPRTPCSEYTIIHNQLPHIEYLFHIINKYAYLKFVPLWFIYGHCQYLDYISQMKGKWISSAIVTNKETPNYSAQSCPTATWAARNPTQTALGSNSGLLVGKWDD